MNEFASSHGKPDLLDFDVDSKSNKFPGGGVAMVVAHAPYLMAAKYVADKLQAEPRPGRRR